MPQERSVRGGHVGAFLDHVEKLDPDTMPAEDRFMVRRLLKVAEDEGGITDHAHLAQIEVLKKKYPVNAPPPPVDPRVAALVAENAGLKATVDSFEARFKALEAAQKPA